MCTLDEATGPILVDTKPASPTLRPEHDCVRGNLFATIGYCLAMVLENCLKLATENWPNYQHFLRFAFYFVLDNYFPG